MRRFLTILAILIPITTHAAHLEDTHFEIIKTYLLDRINGSRAEHNLDSVSYSKNIELVAQGHADDLAAHFDPTNTETREATYLAHTSSDGRALNARYRDEGIDTGWQFAENVGYWIRDPFDEPGTSAEDITVQSSQFGVMLMHDGMMAEVPPNDSHLENILGSYSHVGIGISLLNEAESSLNAIFMVTNYSRYQSESEERRYREDLEHSAATSPRSLQNTLQSDHEGPFIDVEPTSKFAIAITAAKESRIIDGYPDGTFKPEKTVSRAELVKILMGAAGINPIGMEFSACFSDVFNQWFAPYVCVAKRNNWINGYEDNTFQPGQKINRAEAIVIANRILNLELNTDHMMLFNDAPDDAWFTFPLQILASHGLLFFDSDWFYPESNIKRGEVAQIAYEVMRAREDDPKTSGPERSLLK